MGNSGSRDESSHGCSVQMDGLWSFRWQPSRGVSIHWHRALLQPLAQADPRQQPPPERCGPEARPVRSLGTAHFAAEWSSDALAAEQLRFRCGCSSAAALLAVFPEPPTYPDAPFHCGCGSVFGLTCRCSPPRKRLDQVPCPEPPLTDTERIHRKPQERSDRVDPTLTLHLFTRLTRSGQRRLPGSALFQPARSHFYRSAALVTVPLLTLPKPLSA